MPESNDAAAQALLQAAARAKHDLGKYVAFQLRWLPPDAPAGELLEALRADVLATRSGPSGTQTAAQVWADVRPALQGQDVAEIDGWVAQLHAAEAGLRDGTLAHAELRALADTCVQISRGLSALHKRLRS